MRARIDGKAKPPGSLGRIEDLAVQLGLIAHPPTRAGDNAVLLVFAGDHGLTEEGVSHYPSAVTVAMVAHLSGRPRQRQRLRRRQPTSRFGSSTPASPPTCPPIPI